MKLLLFLAQLIFAFQTLSAQNGYVKFKDSDSTLVGFVRPYIPVVQGPHGLEVWRDKRDPEPIRISKAEIAEYAINNDTFRILHQFKPFPSASTFYEYIEAQIVTRGKVTLLSIVNYNDPGSATIYMGGGLVPVAIDMIAWRNDIQRIMGAQSKMYVLENRNGYSAVSPKKKELKVILLDYFPDKFVVKYESVYGEVNYRHLDDMVRFYNSK
jgi:hypothetical protein